MTRVVVLVLLATAACRDPDEEFGEGVAVGNPTKGVTARVLPGPDVEQVRGKVDVDAFTLVGCDGAASAEVARDFVLPPGGRRFELPIGTYCGAALELSSSLTIDGRFEGGGKFELELDLGQVVVDATDPFSTGDQELLLQLGPDGWLGEAALGVVPGDSLVVAPGDELHDTLASDVRGRSLLLVDVNANRRPDAGEKVLAAGSDEASGARGAGPPADTGASDDAGGQGGDQGNQGGQGNQGAQG